MKILNAITVGHSQQDILAVEVFTIVGWFDSQVNCVYASRPLVTVFVAR